MSLFIHLKTLICSELMRKRDSLFNFNRRTQILGSSEDIGPYLTSKGVSMQHGVMYTFYVHIAEPLKMRPKLRPTAVGMYPFAWEWNQYIRFKRIRCMAHCKTHQR